jgi:hypothetical protein
MKATRKQSTALACAVGLLTFGMLSVPARAVADDLGDASLATWESVMPADLPMGKPVRLKPGHKWLRVRPQNGRGGGAVSETEPEEPISPFLP